MDDRRPAGRRVFEARAGRPGPSADRAGTGPGRQPAVSQIPGRRGSGLSSCPPLGCRVRARIRLLAPPRRVSRTSWCSSGVRYVPRLPRPQLSISKFYLFGPTNLPESAVLSRLSAVMPTSGAPIARHWNHGAAGALASACSTAALILSPRRPLTITLPSGPISMICGMLLTPYALVTVSALQSPRNP